MLRQPIPLDKATTLAIDQDFEAFSFEEDMGALSDTDLDKDYEPDKASGGSMCMHKHYSEPLQF